MNKGFRNTFIVAGILVTIGIVFIIGGALLGGIGQLKGADLLHRMGIVRYDYVDKKITSTSTSTTAADAAYDADDIKNLELNIGEAEAKIVRGTGNKITIEADNTVIESRVDGDTLKISNDDDEYLSNANVKITIPKGKHFSEVNIKLGAVESTIEELNCDELDLKLGAGELEISEGNIKDADMEVGAGELRYIGSISGDLDAKCGLGNMSFKLDGDEKDHNYNLKVGLGHMLVGNDSINGAGSRNVDNDTDSDFKIECGAGNVEVLF
jgi:hypothetical protein